MINKDQFHQNLQRLKAALPIKPKKYTPKHPKTITEALSLYANQKTVTGFEMCTRYFHDSDWPLVLWWNPEEIKVGFFNRWYYARFYKTMYNRKFTGFGAFDFLWIPFVVHFSFKIGINDCLEEAFNTNKKFIKQRLVTNHLLSAKKKIITEIFRTYEKGFWIACISTIFPLIDVVARKILKTTNLSTDINKICKLFAQNGFTAEKVDHLMPFITAVRMLDPDNPSKTWEEREAFMEEAKDNVFGIIGPALSSFLRFAHEYYGYYKEDRNESPILLNRHAILHGSMDNFGDKTNVIKLLTFLYLFLELEPVFNLLLWEPAEQIAGDYRL